MIACWLRQHSDYDGSFWNYWIVPQDVGGNANPNKIIFTTTQTGYIVHEGEHAITYASWEIILKQKSVPMLLGL
jgi:hypothetical protein